MKNESWTWINNYGAWLRPKLPRLCIKCKYEGYFKLEALSGPTPNWPFMEVCPGCGSQVECNGVEAKMRFSEEVEELAKKLGKTPQELTNEVFKNLIMEFDPKTGKVHLIRKDTGEEIFPR